MVAGLPLNSHDNVLHRGEQKRRYDFLLRLCWGSRFYYFGVLGLLIFFLSFHNHQTQQETRGTSEVWVFPLCRPTVRLRRRRFGQQFVPDASADKVKGTRMSSKSSQSSPQIWGTQVWSGFWFSFLELWDSHHPKVWWIAAGVILQFTSPEIFRNSGEPQRNNLKEPNRMLKNTRRFDDFLLQLIFRPSLFWLMSSYFTEN